jgi:integrase/recombinase XerD
LTARSCRVTVRGPLAAYAPDFDRRLTAEGYRELTRIGQLQRMGRLSRWMVRQHLDAGELTVPLVRTFLARDGLGKERAQPAKELIAFLGDVGLLVEEPVMQRPDWPSNLLDRYHQMLVVERGLSLESLKVYDRTARVFLEAIGGEAAVAWLDAAAVTDFLLRAVQGRSMAWSKTLVFGLRSFLRFCFETGLVTCRLDRAVPSVAGWKKASLPEAVAVKDLGQLVRSCDRRSAAGRRDYAILLLLSRLGLRAGEVSALGLGDIDWRMGELVIHGKGARRDRLPLPVDVGDALVGYLQRGRPTVSSRSVFITLSAPLRPLSPGGVRAAVRYACRRAGIEELGSHRLRHSAATEMLRKGSSLVEIAQVLRHENLETTSIYAKVDDASLIQVARPWPGWSA